MMASADSFVIKVKGPPDARRRAVGRHRSDRGGLADRAWALQTIISRTVNITEAPAVVTVGRFTGGNRSNIVPDEIELEGTVRAFDESVRKDIHDRVRSIATNIAESAGATATRGVRARLSGDAQRPGADRADAADAAPRGRRRATCSSVR